MVLFYLRFFLLATFLLCDAGDADARRSRSPGSRGVLQNGAHLVADLARRRAWRNACCTADCAASTRVLILTSPPSTGPQVQRGNAPLVPAPEWTEDTGPAIAGSADTPDTSGPVTLRRGRSG